MNTRKKKKKNIKSKQKTKELIIIIIEFSHIDKHQILISLNMCPMRSWEWTLKIAAQEGVAWGGVLLMH